MNRILAFFIVFSLVTSSITPVFAEHPGHMGDMAGGMGDMAGGKGMGDMAGQGHFDGDHVDTGSGSAATTLSATSSTERSSVSTMTSAAAR